MPNSAKDPKETRGPGSSGSAVASSTADTAVAQDPNSPAPSDPNVKKTDWVVVSATLAVVAAVVLWGVAWTDSFSSAADNAFSWTTGNLGWAFVLIQTSAVGFVIYLALSKYGSIRIGADGERPEYRTGSWIAMMFAAGMGIGLMFFGVSEPLAHFHDAPPGVENPTYGMAMATTAFHWGMHPWSGYAVVGLALALTAYRYGRTHLISQAMIPVIGEKNAKGGLGKFLDVLTILATIFGTACSLGLGALQIQTGLNETGAISTSGIGVVIGVIVVLGLAFLASAASGVSKGIQLLSNINMVLALCLALFVAVFSGALVLILNLVPTSLGLYLQNFLDMASRTGASQNGEAGEWLGSWTIFYWAWWVSWSPFVGMFLARISRGRTIRQFVAGVVLVPSGMSIVWFSIFGGTALHLEEIGNTIRDADVSERELFNVAGNLPGSMIIMILAMALIAIFFITSADSASVVMGGMGQYGIEEPARYVTVFFGICTGAIAIIMLLAGGGGSEALDSLQSITIIAASPFLIILVLLAVSIMKMLRADPTGQTLAAMRSPFAWRRLSGASKDEAMNDGPVPMPGSDEAIEKEEAEAATGTKDDPLV